MSGYQDTAHHGLEHEFMHRSHQAEDSQRRRETAAPVSDIPIHADQTLPQFRQRPPLKVIRPPQEPSIPGETASKLTGHQVRSTLLSMHATADRYRTHGNSGPLRTSLRKIAEYEAELAAKHGWMVDDYNHTRDAQRSERQQRQIAPRPETHTTETQACAAAIAGAANVPTHELIRCTAPGCRRLAVVDVSSQAPHCGAHQPAPPPAVEAARKAEAEGSSQAEPSALDKAVEALIRKHTRGTVLDAVWEVSGRISPWR